MGEEIKLFNGSISGHYPIVGMENPTTPIRYEGPALKNNLQGKDKEGTVVLPQVKLPVSR